MLKHPPPGRMTARKGFDMFSFFFFFSGTVRRALARPYYDKTQRMPHAQPDRDVSYLAKLTAMVVGGYCTPGVGFSPTESSTKHKGNRSGPAWENGAHVGASVWPRTPLIRCRWG